VALKTAHCLQLGAGDDNDDSDDDSDIDDDG
jgi:hypothetical protein